MAANVEAVLAALIEGLESGEDSHGSRLYFVRSQPIDDNGDLIEQHDFYCVDGDIDLRRVAERIVSALDQ